MANAIADQKIEEDNQSYLNTFTRPNAAADRANADEDRARVEAGWAQTDKETAASNKAWQKAQDDEATALYGKEHVEDILKYSPYVTADDITTAINKNPDLTRKQKDAALAALPGVFEARTGVTGTAANTVANTPESKNITSMIDRAKEATTRAAANEPLIADHALLNQEHTQDAQVALAELMAATTAANGGDTFASYEDFKTGSGSMAAFYQKMVAAGTSPDGSRLPPGLISKIIQNNLTDGGRYFFFGGGKVDKDEKRILAEIKKFKDPSQVSAMYLASQNYEAEQAQIAGMETKKGEFERVIALAEQNGDTKQVDILRAGYKKYVDDTTGVTADSEKAKKPAEIAEAAIAKAAISGADRAASEAVERKGAQDRALTPEQKAQIAADQAAGIDPSIRAFNDGVAIVLPTEGKAEDFDKAGDRIRQESLFGGSLKDNLAAVNAAIPETMQQSARGLLAGILDPTNAAPALPVEKITQQGTGQFANEPASVVSDMISSSLDLSAKDSETLDLAMRQIEAGLLSDTEEAKSRDLIESILYDSLLKQKGNVSPEVKSLLADIESKYLPLFK